VVKAVLGAVASERKRLAAAPKLPKGRPRRSAQAAARKKKNGWSRSARTCTRIDDLSSSIIERSERKRWWRITGLPQLRNSASSWNNLRVV